MAVTNFDSMLIPHIPTAFPDINGTREPFVALYFFNEGPLSRLTTFAVTSRLQNFSNDLFLAASSEKKNTNRKRSAQQSFANISFPVICEFTRPRFSLQSTGFLT
jgi:hypothetical protein